jgi:hypothetical protein
VGHPFPNVRGTLFEANPLNETLHQESNGLHVHEADLGQVEHEIIRALRSNEVTKLWHCSAAIRPLTISLAVPDATTRLILSIGTGVSLRHDDKTDQRLDL